MALQRRRRVASADTLSRCAGTSAKSVEELLDAMNTPEHQAEPDAEADVESEDEASPSAPSGEDTPVDPWEGFYATDAFEARLLAMEFNAYIRQHPNCIDSILRTEA